ncbi:MAG: hypothetical protein IPP00_03525 [Actinomycetales bacterium]|uniref:Uncharacterized protein n=1 Tax=Candidatus Phosphoribacter hodrii TaxID=2953743 RepID=A0A9D7T6F0_9MICO|nr:hypothetical protein [Candidatus Phosphoribacter hodrii]
MVDVDGQLLSKLQAKLEPSRMRSTLAFAGLFQVTHELIKRNVLDEVKAFYGYSRPLGDPVWITGPEGRAAYERAVIALDPRSPFRASLLWLVNSEAIAPEQMEVLEKIYGHRHQLTHELDRYLVDPAFEPDVDLFAEAVSILRSLTRFWTQVEIDIGTFAEHGDVTVDEATPLSLAVLQLAIDAYVQGLEGGHQS